MPLTVVRQTADGRPLDEVIPPNAILNRILPKYDDASFPLLRYVDPYDDTIFNSSQMRGFVEEWDRLIQTAPDEETLLFLERVRRMAEDCQKNPHTFLCFVGD